MMSIWGKCYHAARRARFTPAGSTVLEGHTACTFTRAGHRPRTTHGLRYTAATVLRELGLDWDDVAAVTGHKTTAMVRKYTAKRRRAARAIARLDEAGV